MSFQQFNVYPCLTPVSAASLSNLSGTYFNGPSNNGVGATLTLATGALTIDGYTPVVGDRIALAAQSNTNENGIYVLNQAGATGISPILQRSSDMQSIEQLFYGQFVSVGHGDSYGGSFLTLCSVPAQLGIDELLFILATGSSSLGTMAFENSNNVSITGGTITGAVGSVTRGTTGTYAGGGTSNAFTVTGMTSSKVVTANILTSTNSVAITKVVPSTNTLTVTFSADPGASTTVNWIAA